jgi:hypothetical protein
MLREDLRRRRTSRDRPYAKSLSATGTLLPLEFTVDGVLRKVSVNARLAQQNCDFLFSRRSVLTSPIGLMRNR